MDKSSYEYSITLSAKIIIWIALAGLIGFWLFLLATVHESTVRVVLYLVVVPLAFFIHMALIATLKARMVIDQKARRIFLYHWGYSTGFYDVFSKKLVSIEFDDIVAIRKMSGRRADNQRVYTTDGFFQFPETISDYVEIHDFFVGLASKNNLPPTKFELQDWKFIVILKVILGILTLAMTAFFVSLFL